MSSDEFPDSKRGSRAKRRPATVAAPNVSPSLRRALKNIGGLVIYQDTDLNVLWSENIPALWSRKDLVGHKGDGYLPGSEAERLTAAKNAVLRTNQSETLQISISGEEGVRWFDVWVDPDLRDGATQGLVTTAIDITEQQRREQTLRALLREVSHRSKNLLSIIQSIATQTGRHSRGIDSFLARFRGRLQSLASSQDLVTSSNWHGAGFRELVAGQLLRYCASPEQNFRLEGEDPYLSPNAALHVGLAVHELTVNSVSFGALSKPDGTVVVSASFPPDDDSALEFVWTEKVALDIETLKEKEERFGTVALKRVVPASLNGSASLTIDAHGLEYRLLIPKGNFEIR
ncbi:MAG: sensor histidine kinase [Rhizobiaceae bacterium]